MSKKLRKGQINTGQKKLQRQQVLGQKLTRNKRGQWLIKERKIKRS